MKIDAVRRAALAALERVEAGEPLETALDAALAGAPDARSRAFLAELVKGSLKWRGRYDHLIARLSRRSRARRPTGLQNVLRLGLHQLLACEGVPAYAALDQSVELCRAAVSARSAPYVNALLQRTLRAAARGGGAPSLEALRPLFPDPREDAAAHLAAWHSHPRWLVERWLARWGFEACERLCRHDNQAAPITLHVLAPADPLAVAARLDAAGHGALPGRRHARALQLAARLDRAALVSLLTGEPGVIVQDEGAQEVTTWLAAGAGGRLLDLCAAPGGKLLHLRAMWCDPSAVFGMDRSAARLARLADTGKRIAGGAPIMVLADGEAPPFALGTFDTILLDGPCSGTGVLRHHPEGRWRLRPQRLLESAQRLRRLAAAAAALLAPGGRLLYATCSLEPEENEHVVQSLLEDAAADLSPDPHPDAAEGGAWQRTWLPQETGTDGFFAARLRRR